MSAYILFFGILPVILIIWGIINVLASKFHWTIILMISQWTTTPFDLAFGKKIIKDKNTAKQDCLISGICMIVIGIAVLLAGAIIFNI